MNPRFPIHPFQGAAGPSIKLGRRCGAQALIALSLLGCSAPPQRQPTVARNAPGSAQAALIEAAMRARDEGKPFDENQAKREILAQRGVQFSRPSPPPPDPELSSEEKARYQALSKAAVAQDSNAWVSRKYDADSLRNFTFKDNKSSVTVRADYSHDHGKAGQVSINFSGGQVYCLSYEDHGDRCDRVKTAEDARLAKEMKAEDARLQVWADKLVADVLAGRNRSSPVFNSINSNKPPAKPDELGCLLGKHYSPGFAAMSGCSPW